MRGALANPWRCAAPYGAPGREGDEKIALPSSAHGCPAVEAGGGCGRTWACNFYNRCRDAWAANSQRQPISPIVLPLRRGLLGRGGRVSQAPRLQRPQFDASGGLADIRPLEIGDAVKRLSA
jgi:hypothetical protein